MMYALYLHFLGLSFRNTSRALEPFAERSHIAVWQWVQRFDPKQRHTALILYPILIRALFLSIYNGAFFANVIANLAFEAATVVLFIVQFTFDDGEPVVLVPLSVTDSNTIVLMSRVGNCANESGNFKKYIITYISIDMTKICLRIGLLFHERSNRKDVISF